MTYARNDWIPTGLPFNCARRPDRRAGLGQGRPRRLRRGRHDRPSLSRASRNCPETVTNLPTGGHGICPVAATGGPGLVPDVCHLHRVDGVGEVADRHRLLAARTAPAEVDAPVEQLAIRAAALVEEPLVAFGAFVDDREPPRVWPSAVGSSHRPPASGVTPAPARAWESRTLSPLV
jgi:hypothetical protein